MGRLGFPNGIVLFYCSEYYSLHTPHKVHWMFISEQNAYFTVLVPLAMTCMFIVQWQFINCLGLLPGH